MTGGEADDTNITVYLWNPGLLFKADAFPPEEGDLLMPKMPAPTKSLSAQNQEEDSS